MKMYAIVTKSGDFVTIGGTETEAKENFEIEFPGEKISSIKELSSKAVFIP